MRKVLLVVVGLLAALVVADYSWAQTGGRGILFQARFNAGTANAVDRTAYDKIKDWISVKDYGATGDGIHNDESAVQQAITNSIGQQLLNFPCPGTYSTVSFGTIDCGIYYPPISATGAIPRSVSRKLTDFVNILDFGAKCDGLTDDSGAVANAIASLPAAGGSLFANSVTGTCVLGNSVTIDKPINFVLGYQTWSLGTNQILITSDGVRLLGSGGSGFGGTGGTQFNYTGTASAIDIGDGTNPIFNVAIKGVEVMATGGAVSSATAIGVRCRNCRYAVMDEVGVQHFQAGTGMEWRGTAGSFDATNQMYHPLFYDNLIGIHMIGNSATEGANDLKVYGGFVIGHSPAPAGSIGVYFDAYSDSAKVIGTDIETYENSFRFANNSSNHTLDGARSEFPTAHHILIDAGASRISIVGFQPENPGWTTATWSDAGTGTMRIDPYGYSGKGLRIWPSTDTTEVFQVTKADGTTTQLDFSTSGTPRLELANSTDLTMYSGNFSGTTFSVTGATGNTTVAGVLNQLGVLQMPNNVGITMKDTGATDRTVLKFAASNVVQFGTTAVSNFGVGAWNFQNGNNTGSITLNLGTGTATVSTSTCVCTDSTAVNAVKCAVSGGTLTATGTGSDVIKYHCF